uniref:Uncharacterized protein n=1 Tax=Plectus sambesii TaxID=2011161 RepID=A0A914VQQ7_9BILA
MQSSVVCTNVSAYFDCVPLILVPARLLVGSLGARVVPRLVLPSTTDRLACVILVLSLSLDAVLLRAAVVIVVCPIIECRPSTPTMNMFNRLSICTTWTRSSSSTSLALPPTNATRHMHESHLLAVRSSPRRRRQLSRASPTSVAKCRARSDVSAGEPADSQDFLTGTALCRRHWAERVVAVRTHGRTDARVLSAKKSVLFATEYLSSGAVLLIGCAR